MENSGVKMLKRDDSKITKTNTTAVSDGFYKNISSSRLRKLFSLIINARPDITSISECDEEGEITFSVLIRDMGITIDQLKEFKGEIFSNFFVDFVGELLVRENIDLFTHRLTNEENYSDVVNQYEHKRFGMKIFAEKLTFSFHASLLQSILTEDFKRGI